MLLQDMPQHLQVQGLRGGTLGETLPALEEGEGGVVDVLELLVEVVGGCGDNVGKGILRKIAWLRGQREY